MILLSNPVQAEELRVLVQENEEAIYISIYGNYIIADADDNIISNGRHIFRKKITLADIKGEIIKVIPTGKRSRIYLGFRRYQGELEIIKNKNSGLDVVNIIDLEEYLKGVLYHEVSHHWPLEALKTQAIISRTYALYRKTENSSQYYDLKADTSSQMYGGATSEKDATSHAVKLTRGKVLFYNDKILPAYFHSCCGGHTEDAGQLWKVDLAPLKGVAGPYCRGTKHWKWRSKVKLDDIARAVNTKGDKIFTIEGIEILSRNNSGRVKEVSIKSPWKKITISGKELRQWIGANQLRSTNFTVKIDGDVAIFTGYGWGHGVGLCQWGAYRLSYQRWTAEDILQYYYPGSKINETE